mmetsp:Transcript_59217/g.183577  ORF Transcript_59217/g.183577 Transcript_59217/m.183577 type:complete len:331 (+) Transcript_59217:929-1921(+)
MQTSRLMACAVPKSLQETHIRCSREGTGYVSWTVARIMTLPSERLQSRPRVSALNLATLPSNVVTSSAYRGKEAAAVQAGSISSWESLVFPSRKDRTSPPSLSPRVFTSSTSPLFRTLQNRARSEYAGPLRICVPPLPKATPAPTEGFRKMDPSTECESLWHSFSSRSLRSMIPAPEKHNTCSPFSPMGRILFRRRRFRTTVGRSHWSLRGTEAPVRAVLAPWGMMATSAATHAFSTSMASASVPGFATSMAVPRPMRAPFRSTLAATLALPMMPLIFSGSWLCSAVSGESQHARKPVGRTRLRTCWSCLSIAMPATTPPAATQARVPRP